MGCEAWFALTCKPCLCMSRQFRRRFYVVQRNPFAEPHAAVQYHRKTASCSDTYQVHFNTSLSSITVILVLPMSSEFDSLVERPRQPRLTTLPCGADVAASSWASLSSSTDGAASLHWGSEGLAVGLPTFVDGKDQTHLKGTPNRWLHSLKRGLESKSCDLEESRLIPSRFCFISLVVDLLSFLLLFQSAVVYCTFETGGRVFQQQSPILTTIERRPASLHTRSTLSESKLIQQGVSKTDKRLAKFRIS
ncbi:unnamed protein product [Zymoseptoria tritici ST99CH_3D7]|uniref:Uncharacterized protein n=1 Tax=Zymoseptoria tritici (strain ST99CH_3D7) TaxID=1276538 RepID=A0A1X7RRK4_ZYMT9|nr:unnamed protein product [Zymoseptoria tritici ST99CH_3D7]